MTSATMPQVEKGEIDGVGKAMNPMLDEKVLAVAPHEPLSCVRQAAPRTAPLWSHAPLTLLRLSTSGQPLWSRRSLRTSGRSPLRRSEPSRIWAMAIATPRASTCARFPPPTALPTKLPPLRDDGTYQQPSSLGAQVFGLPSQRAAEWGVRECIGNYTPDEQQPDKVSQTSCDATPAP